MTTEMIRNSFMDALLQLRSGKAVDELSQQLAELVGAVKKTGKQGTITLQLKVAPATAGEVRQIFVTDAIKFNPPMPARPSTLFYPNEDNQLLRKDPNQKELELRSVEGEQQDSQPLREVTAAS
jgi:hypothetical protein